MKVLITDVETRKAFDIVGILLSKDFEVVLQSSKSFLHRLLLSVIYLKRVREDIDKKSVVLPTEDSTIKDIIDDELMMKIPSKSALEIALDKQKFAEFCEKNSFPIPKTYEYDELLSMQKLPCKIIVKPKSGSGALGIEFVDTFEELKALQIDSQNYIIQERLENTIEVEGGFFLFDKGELVSFYSHKRLKTYPSRGGVTIYSKSSNNLVLKEIGEKLLKKLNWDGFAMIEFIKDKDEYKIIELNPRVWGSIMLSEFCGSDMLSSYVKLCYNKKVSCESIKEGKKIRWLIPWDLKYLLKNFYKLDKKDTCYINFSYSTCYRSMMFLLYNTLNPKILKKLLKKILS